MNVKKISHTSWNCKYHVVFAPKVGNRSNIEEIMQLERDKYNRSGGMCRSCAYVDRDTAEILSIRDNGLFKGEEQFDNLREMGKFEVQIPKQRVLVQRVLCRYGRKEYKKDNRIHKESVKRRCGKQSINNGNGRPIYG